MKDRPPSIFRRLATAIVLAGLIAGLIGVLVFQAGERRELRATAADANRAAAVRAAAVIDGRIDALSAQLRLLATDTAIVELRPEARSELEIALRVSGSLDRLIVFDASGTPVAAAASSELVDVGELEHRPGLLREMGQTPRFEFGTEPLVLDLTVRVDDPPGTPVGVLLGRTPLELLVQDVVVEDPIFGGNVLIASEDGTILVDRAARQMLPTDGLPVDEVFADDRRTAIIEGADGSIIVAGSRLQGAPGWVVVVRSERDAVGPAQRAAGGTTAVFLIVILAILAAVLAVAQRVLRPLRPLANAVTALERGERPVRANVGGHGELAVLADSFDRMAATLDARQEELRVAEGVARRSEARLRLLVEGIDDYGIVLIDQDGAILTWNNGARNVIGYEPHEATRRRLQDLFDADDPPADPIVEAAETGRAEVEGWCRRAEGTRFYARIVIASLADTRAPHREASTGGSESAPIPAGYAAIIHDLTETHVAQEATERALAREQEAAAELRRANQLKDEFLAAAAHEIRTPLSLILGTSSMLSQDDLSETDRTELQTMLDVQANDLSDVVERLLDLTRLQAGRTQLSPESFALRAELQRNIELAGQQLNEHQVTLEAPATEVRTDRNAFRHVVGNLVSNAARFSPPGSSITVRGEVEEEKLIVSVTDEGEGIDPADHERIFELFQRSRSRSTRTDGTGVGLAIVKRYVELLGGDVAVESERGAGTTFTVRLPDGGGAGSAT